MNAIFLGAVRRFRNMEEVRSEPGFRADLLVDLANYQGILGDYDLKSEERCCRRKENGNPCNQGNLRGYVVRLKDGGATIVGNCCAHTKFGDRSTIADDAKRYRNQEEFERRALAFGKYVANKDAILAEIEASCSRATRLERKVNEFCDELGASIVHRLRSMAKAGKGDVSVTFRTRRVNPEDDKEVDFGSVRSTLGKIGGISLFDPENFAVIARGRLRIVRAFTDAAALGKNPKSVRLQEINSVLADYPRVNDNAQRLLELEPGLDATPRWLFCYVHPNVDVRKGVARRFASSLAVGHGKAGPEAWLRERDKQLIEANRATSMVID